MKIVAVLEADAASGGGFNQSLNAIVQMRDICGGRFDFEVLTPLAANVATLKVLGIPATHFRFSLGDRLLSWFGSSLWWHRIQLRLKMVGRFEKNLLRRGCDLVYFVAPSAQAGILQRLNYITTVWDLCHRDTPEFPEVRAFAEFRVRERLFHSILTPAFTVLTDSGELATAIVRRYGVDPERLVVMPFSPAAGLLHTSSASKASVLDRYRLEEGYYFYPAQFWAHKNHVRILEALATLAAGGLRRPAVFCGGDMHNRRHVERVADELGVREQVRCLGFVPMQDMRGLYEGCAAVIMPTYFGPTNLPPLEAWRLGKPLVYSIRCAEHAGDAALCADPDDADDLARAMREVLDADTAARLVARGTKRLQQIDEDRGRAEAELLRRLQQFSARQRCWK